jgi:hypothetical protein
MLVATDDATIECVTQAENDNPYAVAYLEVCDNTVVAIATSRLCPGDDELGGACGGHPICRPCLVLGMRSGWIVEATS